MNVLNSIAAFIGRLWQRGCLGKGIIIFVALLVLGMCNAALGIGRNTPAAVQPTRGPVPSQARVSPAAAAPATTAPEPTVAPLAPTEQPTEAPSPEPTIAAAPAQRATFTPAPVVGAAPQGSDCPADHPVKGNIPDRGANKGEKIYHLPGDNGYAQTKPERCFVDVKEAEAAGFRPVKK